tara:strand:+ start:405 stop:806 length:402 start_codon:yes stop_codon:yes gene_type:complete
MSANSLLQEINNSFELIDDTVLDSMYMDDTDIASIKFCAIRKITKKNNLLLILEHSVWGYLSNRELTELVSISVIFAEPCCLAHSLTLLTDKFKDHCEEIYGEIPECRTYYLEDLEIVSISKDAITVQVHAAT